MGKIKALMVDVSSNNGAASAYDLEKHYEAGYRVFAPKATQSTTYTWSDGDALTRIWHSLGADAVVWRYHFNGATGTPLAQADYFTRAIAKDWRDGDRWVLDVEAIPASGRAPLPSFSGAQANAFQQRMHKNEPGWDAGIYGGPYGLRDRGVRPLHPDTILWLADYASKIAFIPPGWTKVAAWQYTDRASGLPGIPGSADRSTLDASVMPAAHRHKPTETPLAVRHEAKVILKHLKGRGLPVAAGHGDRALLADLSHEAARVLDIKKAS